MTWELALLALGGTLVLTVLSGLPVAFAFAFVNIVGLVLFLGGTNALVLLPGSAFEAAAQFALTPIPLFILMGEILLRTGYGEAIVKASDEWIGRLPGRLSVTAVGGGTFFGAVSGSSMASVAVLSSILLREMEKNRYSPPMSIGAILGAGGLAVLIPPSALAVLLGSLAKISIAELLIAGILPGLILAFFYVLYFVASAVIVPDKAPKGDSTSVPLLARLRTLVSVSPLLLIIGAVTGLIFLGVATPTEAAAIGAVASALLATVQRRLSFTRLHLALRATVRTTAMIMLIIVGSTAFSQLLAATGVTHGMASWVSNLEASPLVVVIAMLAVLFVLGCFLDTISIMLVTVPIFYPVIATLGVDPIWFSVLFLIQMELAGITPPFGVLLFVLKGVRPDIAIETIYKAIVPIVLIQLLLVAALLAWPGMATLLPGMIITK